MYKRQAQNFPWILIDRALGTLACVTQRAHARRDDEQLDSARLLDLLVVRQLASSGWSATDRRNAERVFDAMRLGQPDAPGQAALRTALRGWMSRLDAECHEEGLPSEGARPTIAT